MDYLADIKNYEAQNPQEESDRRLILQYAEVYPNLLCRENEIAHITASGFIMNPALDQVLMVHHNIMNNWAWTGGHADGDGNLLGVALREAREETGVRDIRPLSPGIASIDILTVNGHFRRGLYVSAHLHLSVGYILICGQNQRLHIKPDENTGVRWLPLSYFTSEHFDASDVYLYNKLIRRARTCAV
ncbi:MAG: NUDIX hydrolase [Christensenellales bacterium]|jgi:8-oxo-dGTP pyrophosphatase MutT (NUDIX family)